MRVLITKQLEDGGFGSREERAQIDKIEYELVNAGEQMDVCITDQEIGLGCYQLHLEGSDAVQAAMSICGGANGVLTGFSVILENRG